MNERCLKSICYKPIKKTREQKFKQNLSQKSEKCISASSRTKVQQINNADSQFKIAEKHESNVRRQSHALKMLKLSIARKIIDKNFDVKTLPDLKLEDLIETKLDSDDASNSQ